MATLPALEPTAVPPDSVLNGSQRYLASAYDSVSSLVEQTYPALRDLRSGTRGRLTQAEHDVFRAAIVFAGAGVDTVLKEAIRGALNIRIESSKEAAEKFLDFVTRSIQDGSGISARKIGELLMLPDSASELRARYVQSLTGSSLQSRNQVINSLAALGLPSRSPLFKDAAKLDELFKARNQIAHEMDMTPRSISGRGSRSRHERTITQSIGLAHVGLDYCQRVLNELQATLPAK